MSGSKPDASCPEKHPVFTTLVAGGEPGFSGVLEDFLKAEGHFILRAQTAEDALDKTLRFQPDLILLDNEMEGVKGLALMGRLLLAQASAAVVLLASSPTISESVDAIRLGAADYLDRPLELAKLKRAIDFQKSLFCSP